MAEDFKEITLRNLRREALRKASTEAQREAKALAQSLEPGVLSLTSPSRRHLEVMEKAYLFAAEELLKETSV